MSKVKKTVAKVKKVATPERLAIAMAIIALVSFIYKFTVGALAASLVMIIAAIPTLFVFICKALYAKDMHQPRGKKKKTYFFMMIATVCFVVLFLLFSLLKVGGIDITHENTFTGWIGIVFIFFIMIMFILSIINLRGALAKEDLVVIGIKEITFVSALADAVMINGFLYRVLIKYIADYIPFYKYLNQYFPLAVAVIMTIVPLIMFKRWWKYDVNAKDDDEALVEESKEEKPEEAKTEE